MKRLRGTPSDTVCMYIHTYIRTITACMYVHARTHAHRMASYRAGSPRLPRARARRRFLAIRDTTGVWRSIAAAWSPRVANQNADDLGARIFSNQCVRTRTIYKYSLARARAHARSSSRASGVRERARRARIADCYRWLNARGILCARSRAARVNARGMTTPSSLGDVRL